MEVGGRIFSGKGAREAAAAALAQAVLAGRGEPELKLRGKFRAFEILSRGRPVTIAFGSDEEALPELFIRGADFYGAQINAENPVGTMQSIEHTLRALDKSMADDKERLTRCEKMLGDFQEQLGKPFAHEARLRELLIKQDELNRALDLDKGERQVAPEKAGDPDERDDAPAPDGTCAAEAEPARGYERGSERTPWQARETPRRRQRILKAPTLRPRL